MKSYTPEQILTMALDRGLTEIWNQPLPHETPVFGVRTAEKCARKNCAKPVAYPGAVYCGAGCSARAEAGDL